MPNLDDIRRSLTNNQQQIIDAVWRRYYENYSEEEEWIRCRELDLLFRSLKRTLSIIKTMSGHILYDAVRSNHRRYQLSFLGALLTEQGEEAESLLVDYLSYARERLHKNPQIETLEGKEIEKDLRLSPDQSYLLCLAIDLSRWDGGCNKVAWCARLPEEIADYLDEDAVRKYIREEATQYYDPSYPVLEKDKYFYKLNEAKRIVSEFDFISNDSLKELLAMDWAEVQEVHKVKGRKSCVILCGGVLEGMLLDVLQRVEEQAGEGYQELKRGNKKNIEWSLYNLVEVARKLGYLEENTVSLSHVLREWRNLVHPAKQLRDQQAITDEQANIAVSTVRICIEELRASCKQNQISNT